MKNKDILINLAPMIGLALVIIVFAIFSQGKSISAVNLKVLSNQIIIVALVSIGGVFAFSCGALDMSMGGTMGLSAIIGGIVGLNTGSFWLMMFATIGISMLLSIVKGFLAAYLTLPVFIVTIIFGSLLSAVGLVALGTTTTLSLGAVVPAMNLTQINILFLVGFYVVALILFNYTKIGKSLKLQGGNLLASGQSGIDAKKNVIIAFLISGIGVSLASVMTILKTKTVTAQTGMSIGSDILVAIVLGGMPLSGGPKSKISAAVIGAATITILNNGLSIMNVNNDIIQIVRGIIFLTVVFITSMSYRTKLLPK